MTDNLPTLIFLFTVLGGCAAGLVFLIVTPGSSAIFLPPKR